MKGEIRATKWPKELIVCEVGPRDGLQNEKVCLTVEQKVELIERSVEAGAKIIENWFLRSSQGGFANGRH